MCSFCNQNSITGVDKAPSADDVKRIIESAGIRTNEQAQSTQVAFFGGSFTAIDRNYMLELLEAAYEEVNNRNFAGIRISTRPDRIDVETLMLLKRFGVNSIELGAQSMDDDVLIANQRGHTSQDVMDAAKLIKEYDFELGLQMMTGLYKDTNEKAIETAEKIISLSPDTVRIYPTVVLKNTHLEQLMQSGDYQPQELEEAVKLCSKLIPMFDSENISVIRVGLHAEDSMQSEVVGGAFHPAMRELCMSEIFINKLVPKLNEKLEKTGKKSYNIRVNAKNLSVAIGQQRKNVKTLEDLGFEVKFIPCEKVKQGEFEIEPSCVV